MDPVKPTESEALIQSNRKTEALEQKACELAHSVERTRQQTLAKSNEKIETLEQKARDLARFVETARLHILSQSDQKIEALEQRARDLADFVETLRSQAHLQSEGKIKALVEKAGDLAHLVETVRKETRLQFETEIATMGQKARDLAASVEALRETALLESNSAIAVLGHSHDETVAMNEALLLGSLRQHELTEAAEKVNAQLCASEERLRLFIENAPAAIAQFDREMRYIAVSRRWVTDFGLTGEIIGRSHYEIFPMISDEWKEVHRRVLAGETMRSEGERFERADVREHWVKWEALPWRDSTGEIGGTLIAAEEITARMKAEIAWRQNAELFSTLVEQAPSGVYVVDGQFRMQQVNLLAQPVFASVQPLIGRDFAEILNFVWGPEIGGKVAAVFRHTLATGERYISPPFSEIRHDLGVRQAFEWETQRITLPDGQHGVVCYFTDTSERRAMEDFLAAHAAELARADRSKDEFLAMLAHELRNPLASLRNAVEILHTPATDAAECEQAHTIMARQLENMTRLLDDLLDISRITSGKIELRRQPVALAEILQAAASVARPGITVRSQELAITLPADPIFLNADSTRLEQVFSNLLTNASKYSYTGSHITLSAERAAGVEPPEVIVRVNDDGMGIAPELLPHIFDLFVQSTRSLDRKHGGLGIGLTLVRRLVEMHEGTVEACSAGLSHGSEFTVRLPILAAPVPAPALPEPPSPVAREMPRRILVVDDNEDSTRSMALLQRRRGHETHTAFTGPEAVAAAAGFLPEVVLLDIGLPGMDGFEVAHRLRAMPAMAGALLVAMSGYSSDEDRAKARAAGFDEYMVKPVDLDRLRELLRSRD